MDICSGPRCHTKRKILDLLRKKNRDGSFAAYGGARLKNLIGVVASGAIRDLRDAIVNSLRDAGIECDRMDVIVSGPRGYCLSNCLSVQIDGPEGITDITEFAEGKSVLNDTADVPNRVVNDTPDVPDPVSGVTAARQEWIVRQLKDGRPLKGTDVAKHFHCSTRTAGRLLKLLVDGGKIEFDGPPRTGHYRLCRSTEGDL